MKVVIEFQSVYTKMDGIAKPQQRLIDCHENWSIHFFSCLHYGRLIRYCQRQEHVSRKTARYIIQLTKRYR